ncbi:hypothetical protein MBLNU230_g0123t1 [Neophaeotheca triangularis]
MDLNYLTGINDQDNTIRAATKLAGFIFASIYCLYQLAVYFDFSLLAPQELLWNGLVRALPARLLLDSSKRQELQANDMLSQIHAAKSEALRKAFGIGGNSFFQSLPNIPGEGIMRRASMLAPKKITSDAPPGLGNWDNSCYQNSVLQGLAALDSLPQFLTRGSESLDDGTGRNLSELVAKLQNPENNGRHIWTPAKLKNMSSWQQQDAQEYFSKVMDELDKEVAKSAAAEGEDAGLEDAVNERRSEEDESDAIAEEGEHTKKRNPLEGLLAQRVACTRCGFTEGLSMIPFNCLTVPLGSAASYDVGDCLDEYTGLEEISDVECAKCTLLKTDSHLKKMLAQPQIAPAENPETPSQPEKMSSLPPELREMVAKRLHAVESAIENDDFADKTLSEACQISKKAHVSSTKTRQAVIGRAPRSLAIHVNRSVFDEMTGAQRKNYASVRYPAVLDLRPWMLGGGQQMNSRGEALEAWRTDAKTSMLSAVDSSAQDHHFRYHLKAVVTHYGRHENGHYICYRKHVVHSPLKEDTREPEPEDDSPDVPGQEVAERWWRLSDEDVSPVSETDVLGQGGVFMLFYERTIPGRPQPSQGEPVAVGEGETNSLGERERESIPLDQTDEKSQTASQAPHPVSAVKFAEPISSASSGNSIPTPETTTDGESELDEQTTEPSKPVPAPVMRTSSHETGTNGKAKGRSGSSSFAGGFRPMAAT